VIQGILLDRDGTINVERSDYVRSTRDLVLLPGALAALVRLATLDVPILVVTNQSCVGRNLITERELESIHTELANTVRNAGGRIDGFYACVHHPDEGCDCRKPRPGLLQQAMADYKLNPEECIMVGDSLSDCSAAGAAGCRCILVCTGLQGEMLATKLPGAAGQHATHNGFNGTPGQNGHYGENGHYGQNGQNGVHGPYDEKQNYAHLEPQIAQSLWHASRLILEQAYRTERGRHVA
jgi:D-glycero-D-manno-heptose 1,7-bisphosphate phosphatase